MSDVTKIVKSPIKTASKWALGSGAVITAVYLGGLLMNLFGKKAIAGETVAKVVNAGADGYK